MVAGKQLYAALLDRLRAMDMPMSAHALLDALAAQEAPRPGGAAR